MIDSKWFIEDFEAGDLPLSNGGMLRNARLRYHQIGELNAPKDNLILLPTFYGGAAAGNHPWVTPGGPLDPAQYCIVIPALLGAGESSSPSNTPGAQAGADFPRISLYDNVLLQKRLVDQRFGGARVALVMGWSMGGMQALQWGCLFPERVGAVLAACATARCYPHNRVFLEGVKAALTCDPAFQNGRYQHPPVRGLAAFGTVYAGWAYSQAFYRRELYRNLGFASIEQVLSFWERDHQAQDANDLLAVLDTWQSGDISDNPVLGGDYLGALARLSMPTAMLPGSTDLYFTEADAWNDARAMPGARCEPLVSDFGHVAGGPGRDPDSHARILAVAGSLLQQGALS
ncbi:alpha/beta fold hydrolase [Marinobacter pelagius]|uniref:alpha/beta fold hydrolase n=1 Tax=Marinobacter sp. C7 TaxID=2951363 RepID=UPI001EEFC442|nr:alpha/beta fold hydrolase [Marinobacter sp. C7]MCG7198367.1 alpha/beta fold hydrolase [Marinobacter sp. C7]